MGGDDLLGVPGFSDPDPYASGDADGSAPDLATLRARLSDETRRRLTQVRQELAELGPVRWLALQRERERITEAEELAVGCRHLTVVHGYLESEEDLQRMERLMAAIEVWCAGRVCQRVGRNDRFTLTIGPPRDPAAELPDVDTVARELAAQAAELAGESAQHGGWRWRVYLARQAPDPPF